MEYGNSKIKEEKRMVVGLKELTHEKNDYSYNNEIIKKIYIYILGCCIFEFRDWIYFLILIFIKFSLFLYTKFRFIRILGYFFIYIYVWKDMKWFQLRASYNIYLSIK